MMGGDITLESFLGEGRVSRFGCRRPIPALPPHDSASRKVVMRLNP
jgi:hypothetical protein